MNRRLHIEDGDALRTAFVRFINELLSRLDFAARKIRWFSGAEPSHMALVLGRSREQDARVLRSASWLPKLQASGANRDRVLLRWRE
jgi:hypothetical protein